ncbi:MAG: hypothetical protein A2734_02890 [Parcubacteria group bacterium RIFCSPHIGHO2_01_FULL_40_30]|nr:MAG: hypothetical protein A2734_02890 [Parcubacteria group bacterium RIFCSPHIGHO2_01_FULL_40_30]
MTELPPQPLRDRTDGIELTVLHAVDECLPFVVSEEKRPGAAVPGVSHRHPSLLASHFDTPRVFRRISVGGTGGIGIRHPKLLSVRHFPQSSFPPLERAVIQIIKEKETICQLKNSQTKNFMLFCQEWLNN